MLQITIPGSEFWDEQKEQFVYSKDYVLYLEHSLVSISKWESRWQKPFLSSRDKTQEEILDYIKCMTITQNVDPDAYNHLTRSNIEQINSYIESPMTATTFREDKNAPKNHEIITSEIIYYWMVAHNIPFECQKWHLNRLLTLIRVCNIKNQPPKKRSKKEILASNAAINAARRKELNTSG